MKLKQTKVYYLAISVPLLLLVFLTRFSYISSLTFCLGMLLYAIFYHPLLSGIRLYELGKIPRKWIVKSLIPFWNLKYFRELNF